MPREPKILLLNQKKLRDRQPEPKQKSLSRAELGFKFDDFEPQLETATETQKCGPRWKIILEDINKYVIPNLDKMGFFELKRRKIITKNSITPTLMNLLYYDGRCSIFDHMLKYSKDRGIPSVSKAALYAFFAGRQAQQLINANRKSDCWVSRPEPFVGPGGVSKIISKNDYYKCEKLKFDIQWVNEVINHLSAKYWNPYPSLCLDDKCDDFKGRHPAKCFRSRKPKPHMLLGYALCDSHYFRISYFPRFPPYCQLTSEYQAYKKMWENHLLNPHQNPEPLPWKKQYSSAVKTKFNLKKVLLWLLSYLPVNNNKPLQTSFKFHDMSLEELKPFDWGFYNITMDREFGTQAILLMLRELNTLGYNIGFKSKNLNSVFTQFLTPIIEDKDSYSEWCCVASEQDMAVSYHSSSVCNFISNIFPPEETDQDVPLIVEGFRKRMRYVDLHDQQCNLHKFPFRVSRASKRLWNAWDRSIQVNCDIIFNHGVPKEQRYSSRKLILMRVDDLSLVYRSKRQKKAAEKITGFFSFFFFSFRSFFFFFIWFFSTLKINLKNRFTILMTIRLFMIHIIRESVLIVTEQEPVMNVSNVKYQFIELGKLNDAGSSTKVLETQQIRNNKPRFLIFFIFYFLFFFA
jgi:hypothetical protein